VSRQVTAEFGIGLGRARKRLSPAILGSLDIGDSAESAGEAGIGGIPCGRITPGLSA